MRFTLQRICVAINPMITKPGAMVRPRPRPDQVFDLTRIIHECCCALACSPVQAGGRLFARNEFLVPQGTFSAASGIHLVSRPYAWLRTPSSESVANKGPAHKSAG